MCATNAHTVALERHVFANGTKARLAAFLARLNAYEVRHLEHTSWRKTRERKKTISTLNIYISVVRTASHVAPNWTRSNGNNVHPNIHRMYTGCCRREHQHQTRKHRHSQRSQQPKCMRSGRRHRLCAKISLPSRCTSVYTVVEVRVQRCVERCVREIQFGKNISSLAFDKAPAASWKEGSRATRREIRGAMHAVAFYWERQHGEKLCITNIFARWLTTTIIDCCRGVLREFLFFFHSFLFSFLCFFLFLSRLDKPSALCMPLFSVV